MVRIVNHPILGKRNFGKPVILYFKDQPIQAYEGETIATALLANGIRIFGKTKKKQESRGLFCGRGQCNSCLVIVDGKPSVRACVTFVKDGMVIEPQEGLGQWKKV